VTVSLEDLARALHDAWTAETAYAAPAYLARAPDRPSRGQCGTTALVVEDLLGGELLVAPVSVSGVVQGVHYWNRLAGRDVDLTADQFTADEVVGAPVVVERSPLPAPPAAQAAYLLLRERVAEALGAVNRPSVPGAGSAAGSVPAPDRRPASGPAG
jgi:hypothetical protein